MAECENSDSQTAVRPTGRIDSIDAFRGFVIGTMVFVNHVAWIEGAPSWLLHTPAGQEGMTLVDVVFPAFLFAMGLSIPLALQGRGPGSRASPATLMHAALRVGLLLAIGVGMVNGEERLSTELTGMPTDHWIVAFSLGAILLLHRDRAKQRVSALGRALGAAVLLWLAVDFQAADHTGLQPSWWGILGLLGWAYAVAALCYLICGRNRTALIGALGLLITLYQGAGAGAFEAISGWTGWIEISTTLGTQPAIALAGLIAGTWIETPDPSARPLRALLLFAASLTVAGLLLRPVHGLSKIQATDAWALCAAGASCFGFACFQALGDRVRTHAAWLLALGRNPLLAYFLPDLVTSGLTLAGAAAIFGIADHGALGVLRAGVFAAVIVCASVWLTRGGIALKL